MSTPIIGAVSYLNTLPLLHRLPFPIRKEVPSQLWNFFQQGAFDAALLSTYNALHLEESAIVDGVAIGSRGEVYSVLLAYEGELEELKEVQLDPSSHTANHLLQIILKEFYGLTPRYVLAAANLENKNLPRLIIGDPAIEFRKKATCSILDLSTEWFRFTQLPFVFAVWCLKKDSLHQEMLSSALRQAKNEGLLQRSVLAAKQPDPAFALRYWTDYISYELGEEEWRGLRLFGKLLEQHKLMR